MYNTDTLIDAFLDGKPRADTWLSLKETLQQRRNALKIESESIAKTDPRRDALQRKMAELRRQIAAIAQEEAISRFVEDSVRATLARPHPLETSTDAED